MQEVKTQKIADKIEAVETWTFWGGISLFVITAVALALIVKFPASWRLLLSLGAVFGILGTLSFVFGKYAAFLVSGGWVLLPLILIGVAIAIYKNWSTVKAKAVALETSAQAMIKGIAVHAAGSTEAQKLKDSILDASRKLGVEGVVDNLVQTYDPPVSKV